MSAHNSDLYSFASLISRDEPVLQVTENQSRGGSLTSWSPQLQGPAFAPHSDSGPVGQGAETKESCRDGRSSGEKGQTDFLFLAPVLLKIQVLSWFGILRQIPVNSTFAQLNLVSITRWSPNQFTHCRNPMALALESYKCCSYSGMSFIHVPQLLLYASHSSWGYFSEQPGSTSLH